MTSTADDDAAWPPVTGRAVPHDAVQSGRSSIVATAHSMLEMRPSHTFQFDSILPLYDIHT